MSQPQPVPALPPGSAPVFRATVHGLPFGDRTRHLSGLDRRDELTLVPELPDADEEQVWVHVSDGHLLGHLPLEIADWLAPWMRRGGRARAQVLKVGDETVPSWKRLIVEVTCSA